MSKRILSLVLAMVMVLGTFGTMVFAESGNEKVDWLMDQGIVEGDEKGNLNLSNTIDRASVAKLVVEALDLGAVAEGMKNYKTSFTDVPATHWANGYINVVSARGIMIGNAGEFMPSNQISYAEVLTILVRVMDGEQENAVWPTTYIAKAHELGILEDVDVVSYQEAAIRERIFEMFYNAMTNMEVGNYTVVKAIVLENNRVETIGKNDVVVEIIRELQRADYAEESRLEKGDQERYTIDAKVGDVEEMLGKVYDFTLNKNGEVVKVNLDTTYTYFAGPLHTITRNKVNGYTVELDERYRQTDERIFRTYHNDKAYAYADFDREFDSVDYARVTVKNGKVLYIDAYTFEDIAPVQEVRRNGLDVYVYNDNRDARAEKFEPRALVIGFNDGKFSRIEREDISANDVVHVYSRNRMIVKLDALVEGTYEKVERDRYNDYYAYIDGEGYFIADEDYFRPVYAHDSKEFITLNARDASRELAQFYKEEVMALVDINGGLQLFGGNLEYTEGFAIIKQVLARGEVDFVLPNDDILTLEEDRKSDIGFYRPETGDTINKKINLLNTKALAFVLSSEDVIDTLVELYTEEDMRDDLVTLKSAKSADMNNSYIRLDDDFRYRVLDRTNVFVIKGNTIAGTTVAKLQAGLKADSEVKAFVLSDADVTKLIDEEVIYDRHRITNDADIAHTIVFFDVDYSVAGTDGEVVLVDSVYEARTPHYVVGHTADNQGKDEVVRDAAAGVSLRNLNTDDIVELRLTKDDDKLVRSFNVLIASDKVKTESYKVVEWNERTREIVLEDGKEVKTTKWLVENYHEFGTITDDSVVTFSENTDGDINAIRVYRRGTDVTANAEEVETNAILEKVLAGNIVQIKDKDGVVKLYQYAGNATEDLAALEGKEITFKIQVLNGVEYIYNIELVETTPGVEAVAFENTDAKLIKVDNAFDVTVEDAKKETNVGKVTFTFDAPVKVKSVTTKLGVVADATITAKLTEYGINPAEFTNEFIVTLDKTFESLVKYSPATIVVVNEEGIETTLTLTLTVDPVEEDPVEEDPVEEDPVEEDPVEEEELTWVAGEEGSFTALTGTYMGTLNIPESLKGKVEVKLLDKDMNEVAADGYEVDLDETNGELLVNLKSLIGTYYVQILADGEEFDTAKVLKLA